MSAIGVHSIGTMGTKALPGKCLMYAYGQHIVIAEPKNVTVKFDVASLLLISFIYSMWCTYLFDMVVLLKPE